MVVFITHLCLFLKMETKKIWSDFNDELYFFILKKVKNRSAANDIFQNTFLKIHKNLSSVKDDKKIKSWIFQIARNETANYFNKESIYVEEFKTDSDKSLQEYQEICCLDRFINDLPKIYREVIELVYLKGHKQKDVGELLGISLESVKARLKRAKDILKKNFNACCKYEFNEKGNLVGDSNCAVCEKD